MSVKVNIAQGLKKVRKAANRTVNEVGAYIGKSGKTISAWEVGRGQPDGDELIAICEFLECHLSDFYGDEYSDYIYGSKIAIETLDDDEKELIGYYRTLPIHGRHAVLAGLRDFAGNQ